MKVQTNSLASEELFWADLELAVEYNPNQQYISFTESDDGKRILKLNSSSFKGLMNHKGQPPKIANATILDQPELDEPSSDTLIDVKCWIE